MKRDNVHIGIRDGSTTLYLEAECKLSVEELKEMVKSEMHRDGKLELYKINTAQSNDDVDYTKLTNKTKLSSLGNLDYLLVGWDGNEPEIKIPAFEE